MLAGHLHVNIFSFKFFSPFLSFTFWVKKMNKKNKKSTQWPQFKNLHTVSISLKTQNDTSQKILQRMRHKLHSDIRVSLFGVFVLVQWVYQMDGVYCSKSTRIV